MAKYILKSSCLQINIIKRSIKIPNLILVYIILTCTVFISLGAYVKYNKIEFLNSTWKYNLNLIDPHTQAILSENMTGKINIKRGFGQIIYVNNAAEEIAISNPIQYGLNNNTSIYFPLGRVISQNSKSYDSPEIVVFGHYHPDIMRLRVYSLASDNKNISPLTGSILLTRDWPLLELFEIFFMLLIITLLLITIGKQACNFNITLPINKLFGLMPDVISISFKLSIIILILVMPVVIFSHTNSLSCYFGNKDKRAYKANCELLDGHWNHVIYHRKDGNNILEYSGETFISYDLHGALQFKGTNVPVTTRRKFPRPDFIEKDKESWHVLMAGLGGNNIVALYQTTYPHRDIGLFSGNIIDDRKITLYFHDFISEIKTTHEKYEGTLVLF